MKSTVKSPTPVEAELPVFYVPIECPECGNTDCPVTSTQVPIRHHKCRACSHCFKSQEKRLSEILNR